MGITMIKYLIFLIEKLGTIGISKLECVWNIIFARKTEKLTFFSFFFIQFSLIRSHLTDPSTLCFMFLRSFFTLILLLHFRMIFHLLSLPLFTYKKSLLLLKKKQYNHNFSVSLSKKPVFQWFRLKDCLFSN